MTARREFYRDGNGNPCWRDLPIDLPALAADQKTLAERRWRAPTKPRKPQAPCDVGLFSDDRDQLDLVEMFADPANE